VAVYFANSIGPEFRLLGAAEVRTTTKKNLFFWIGFGWEAQNPKKNPLGI
jgi:hypothetical protein